MAQRNISFFECDDESYLITNQYLFGSRIYEYENANSYYNINVNNILPYKKRDKEYVIRYIDANKSAFPPIQLKINNFYYEIHDYNSVSEIIYIENDDKEFFKKCREIWNRITKLIGINNARDFVKTDLYDDEFNMAHVHKNTSFVEGNYGTKLVIVLDSVFNGYLKTSLIQVKTHK